MQIQERKIKRRHITLRVVKRLLKSNSDSITIKKKEIFRRGIIILRD